MDNGGHSVFACISKFFDNEEKPAYAPGSSLSAVKSAAASLNMAHMSVTAGSVTVTDAGAGLSAPGASLGVQLPAHHETPTPGAAQAGQYVDLWMSAFKLRSQSLSSGRTFNLSDADSNDVAKVAATEVDQRLKNINPEQYAKQLQGGVANTATPEAAFMSDWQKALQASGLRSDVKGRRAQLPQPGLRRPKQSQFLGQLGRGPGARLRRRRHVAVLRRRAGPASSSALLPKPRRRRERIAGGS